MSRRFDQDQQDEAFARTVEAIRYDRMQVLALDDGETQGLDFDEFVRIFTVLADVGGKPGLLQTIADRIGDLPAGYLDEFAALCRLADSLHDKREQAIRKEAEEQLDSEELEDEFDPEPRVGRMYGRAA